jgi:putative endonuclease
MYYTYILKNITKTKRYKGHTENLQVRLLQHNQGKTKSTKGDQWFVEYYEEFELRSEAIKREKYFKSAAGRRWIKSTLGKLDSDSSTDTRPNVPFGTGGE